MMDRVEKPLVWLTAAAMVLAAGAALPSPALAQVSGLAQSASHAGADLGATASASPKLSPPPSSSGWTGLYVGGLFAGAWSKADATSTTVYNPAGFFTPSSVGPINASGIHALQSTKTPFGGEAGFNGQAGLAVIGLEGDFNVAHVDESASTTAVYVCCAPTTFTITQSVKTRWIVTVRGRAGAAIGRALVFGTAGLAMTDLDYEAVFTDTYASTHENGGINETQKALVLGGGIEFKGGAHWSLKGEYLHADFGTLTTTSHNLTAYTPPIAFPATVFTHSTTFRFDLLRVGINVGF